MRRTGSTRPGSILPLVALMVIVLVMFVALAIDIGMMTLARNQCQIAADAAALAGVRQLHGEAVPTSGSAYGVDEARTEAENQANQNAILGNLPDTVTVDVGSYYYDDTAGVRKFVHLVDSKPDDELWSAVQVNVTSGQSAFFAPVTHSGKQGIGFTGYTAAARATSVHRPRDVSLILDFSISMQFGSSPALPWDTALEVTGSHNPDLIVPNYGHWSTAYMQDTTNGPMINTLNLVRPSPSFETHAPNNYTIETDGGPPIIKDFYYTNSTVSAANMIQAWNWTYSTTLPTGNQPAQPMPRTLAWSNQTDANYLGDKWAKRGAATGSPGAEYARNVQEVISSTACLGGTLGNHARNNGSGVTWEKTTGATYSENGFGYDLIVGNGNFKGYSMGPGWYGKTFFIWPPDPREPVGTDPAVLGYVAGDWRKRFFNFAGTTNSINGQLFEDDPNGRIKTASSVNYTNVLAWIKNVGPKVFPPNLRAGRLLYYSSIPDSIPATPTTDDQRFWKNYIDYVLGQNGTGTPPLRFRSLYGQAQTAWSTTAGATSSGAGSYLNLIVSHNSLGGQDGNTGTPADNPYMRYDECPADIRLHFWFGPLTFLQFISAENRGSPNWLPGTCHEAQCWQLKAGVNSALDDIKKNHPNDTVSLCYFSTASNYRVARVKQGRDYSKLKNALFFPFTYVDGGTMGVETNEMRPYNSSFGNQINNGVVPNAEGGTCPEHGFRAAYNQFSTAGTGTGPSSPYNGRKGAAKVVIFETDGAPNNYATPADPATTGAFQKGTANEQNSYFKTTTGQVSTGLNDAITIGNTVKAVEIITNSDSHASFPGYSGAVTARVHALGFGDLFDPASDPSFPNSRSRAAIGFLLKVQVAGKTSAAGSTYDETSGSGDQIESYKYITGDYTDRITKLREALERIMQSGVQVTLIKGTGEY